VRLLAFPAGEPGGEEAHLQPGVRLFLDRVRTSFPEYDPDRQEIVLAARLVRLLRGDPVAIELAAQQLPSRSVHDLVELHERVAGGQGIPGRSPEVGG
jgi:hypothetical protein